MLDYSIHSASGNTVSNYSGLINGSLGVNGQLNTGRASRFANDLSSSIPYPWPELGEICEIKQLVSKLFSSLLLTFPLARNY